MRTEVREFAAFSAWRRGYARFLPDALKDFAKRFVTDVEPIVGEALPDLLHVFPEAWAASISERRDRISAQEEIPRPRHSIRDEEFPA